MLREELHRQPGRQTGMPGLMLSLPTVMCCYATQAEKALLCVFTPGCTTRGEAGSERRGERRKEEDERIEYRGRKKMKSTAEAGLEEQTKGGVRGGEEKQNIRKNYSKTDDK